MEYDVNFIIVKTIFPFVNKIQVILTLTYITNFNLI